MDTWQQYTLRANTEFQLSCYGNAILMHNQALDYARHQFAVNASICPEHAISRVLISNFSLADCYCAIGQFRRVADCYLAAQQFLLASSQQLAASAETHAVIQHANTHLHALWSAFVSQHLDDLPYACQLQYHKGSGELLTLAASTAVLH